MAQKDYSKKDFKNPYFSKIKSGRQLKHKFWLILITTFIIAGAYFIISGDRSVNFLEIKKIEVAGAGKNVNQQEIESLASQQFEQKRFWLFSQKNVLFFNKKQLKASLAGSYLFSDIKIKKRIPGKIIIIIKEKDLSLVWMSGSEKYYLDLEGVVVKQIDSEQSEAQQLKDGTSVIRAGIVNENYAIVYDQSNSSVSLGQSAIKPQLANFITELHNRLQSDANLESSYYSIASPFSDQIILTTVEGWQVYFRTTDTVSSQISRLITILQQRVDNRSRLEYIDLRFQEKVFYK